MQGELKGVPPCPIQAFREGRSKFQFTGYVESQKEMIVATWYRKKHAYLRKEGGMPAFCPYHPIIITLSTVQMLKINYRGIFGN
jgi:hypothetical protein